MQTGKVLYKNYVSSVVPILSQPCLTMCKMELRQDVLQEKHDPYHRAVDKHTERRVHVTV